MFVSRISEAKPSADPGIQEKSAALPLHVVLGPGSRRAVRGLSGEGISRAAKAARCAAGRS